MGVPTIEPIAIQSPVVSTMVTIMTTIIDKMEPMSKVGRPKEKGVTRPNQEAFPTSEKSVCPKAMAMIVPPMRPNKTETLLKKPLPPR